MTGKITKLNINETGIIMSGNSEYFFESSELRGIGFEELAEGDTVTFTETIGIEDYIAKEIQRA